MTEYVLITAKGSQGYLKMSSEDWGHFVQFLGSQKFNLKPLATLAFDPDIPPYVCSEIADTIEANMGEFAKHCLSRIGGMLDSWGNHMRMDPTKNDIHGYIHREITFWRQCGGAELDFNISRYSGSPQFGWSYYPQFGEHRVNKNVDGELSSIASSISEIWQGSAVTLRACVNGREIVIQSSNETIERFCGDMAKMRSLVNQNDLIPF